MMCVIPVKSAVMMSDHTLKASDLATNTRVKILSITSRVIRARTLDENPRNVIIPRKLDFGES